MKIIWYMNNGCYSEYCDGELIIFNKKGEIIDSIMTSLDDVPNHLLYY